MTQSRDDYTTPNDVIVDTWSELQDRLFNNSDMLDTKLQRYRSPFVFRGLPDKNYKLETTLMRLGGPYQELEKNLLRNFKKYSRQHIVEQDSEWHWLSIAQHHHLPTRLMDWTFSPYVAIHFAMDSTATDKMATDGAIWAINIKKANQYLPMGYQKCLEEENAIGFSVEMLSRNHIDPFKLGKPDNNDFCLFFYPPSLDDRIVNQYALFSVMPDSQMKLNEWLDLQPDLWFRIIIPAKLKWEIRDKLDQANITERVLFPGLDGLCDWLKRHYSPGPKK